MATQNDALKDRLSRYREINISVTGRTSGRTISNPSGSYLDGDKVYLLPVKGSDTQWYKNVLKNPTIEIDARGAEAESCRRFLRLMPKKYRLWSINFARSTGRAT